MIGEKLFTVREVANVLRVSEPTVRRWLTRGFLRSVKLGRRRVIPGSEIERVVREGLRIEKN